LALGDLAILTPPDIPTLRRYSEQWLRLYAEVECKPSTVASYRQLLRLYLYPRFGETRLDAITRDAVKEYLASLVAQGKLSRNTLRPVWTATRRRVRSRRPTQVERLGTASSASISPEFNKMYSKVGRPSIPPEQLLRALLLQMLYSVRSERLLVEEIDYNILFRWFVGLNLDDEVWDSHGVHQEPRPFARGRSGQGVSDAGCGASTRAGMGVGRALHGRWKFAGSLGQREEFSA
jgi:Transposase domain (DUF772)/Phage integrase, N-terminal SAM-like domain